MSLVRRQKIASQLKSEISDIINRKISDPRIGKLTITDVQVRPDMKTALVKYCKFMEGSPGEASEEVVKDVEAAVLSAQAFIFSNLRKRMALRYLPNLFFNYDHSFEGSARVWNIISHLSEGNEPAEIDGGEL